MTDRDPGWYVAGVLLSVFLLGVAAGGGLVRHQLTQQADCGPAP